MCTLTEFPFLEKSVIDVVNKEGFENNYKVIVKNVTKKGDNFLGEIYFVSIKDSKKSLDLVAKSALKNNQVRADFLVKEAYDNEMYFYNNVYPTLKQFEIEAGAIHLFTGVPKCYGHSTESGSETLLFENLTVRGFEILNKKSLFDEDHVKMVFDNYAHLHALSFVYKDKKPEEYNKLTSNIQNLWNKIKFDVMMTTMSKTVKDVIKYFTQRGDMNIVNKLHKYAENTSDIFYDCLNIQTKYNCILHGDCWTNNMMFKYEQNDDKRTLIDMKLLDFQIMFCGSPARDLTYAFYASASKKEFDEKDEFLKFYYEKFSTYVKELGSDPNKLYPLEALKEDFKIFSVNEVLRSLVVNKLKVSSEVKDLNDLTDENSEFLQGDYDEKEFYERAKNLVLHFDEENVL